MDDSEGIMVVYNGIWINTDGNRIYEGGKSKGLLVSRNVTLSELKQKIYVLMKGEGGDGNVELNYPTPLSQMGRTYIAIEDDGDLKYFLQYNRAVMQSTVVPIIASIESTSVQCIGHQEVNDNFPIVEAVDNANIGVHATSGVLSIEEPGVRQEVGTQQECVNEENIGHDEADTVYPTVHVNDAAVSICEGNARGNICRSHVRATSYNHRPQSIVYAEGLGGGHWNYKFNKGTVFPTKRALALSITLAACRGDFQYRVVNSNTRRLDVICWEPNCPWFLNSRKIGATLLFVITAYHGVHECDELEKSSTKRQCLKHLVCDAVKHKMQDPRTQFTANDIVNDVQQRFNMKVSYPTAWRSRELAFEEIRGSPEESYGRLPAYCYQLERRNPGTVTFIHTEGGNRFKYFFMALGQCIRGFKSTMRPVLAVDATFLKCKFKGVLLVATALDGNRQIYPVAFGIADMENEESWLWFFQKLAEVIGDDPQLVIVSDRKQEIGTAFAKVFDRALHGLCYYHLQGNIKHKFGMKKYDHALYCFDRACKSYRIAEFDSHFRQITDPDVRKYVLDIGIMKWSRAHCAARRYNVMTTNIAESVNGMLRHARLLPVQQLVEHIRSVLQRWFAERVAQAKKCTSQLCPKLGERKLRKRKRAASGMSVVRLDQHVYYVRDGDTDGEVNLSLKTCTCRKFDLEQLPCKHALAVCRTMNFSVYRLASPLYSRDFWEAAYSEVIYPVHAEDSWETPAHVKDLVVLPPISKVMPGRRKKQRVLSHGEERTEKKCSRCGGSGHYRVTCKGAIPLRSSSHV